MNKVWVTQQNYDHERKRVNYGEVAKDPEKYGYRATEGDKVTVPGQAQTVKEIMTRYETGKPTQSGA